MPTKQKGGTGGYKKSHPNTKETALKKQQKEKEKQEKKKQLQEEKEKQYRCKSDKIAEYKRNTSRKKNTEELNPIILSDKEKRTLDRNERKENNEPRYKPPKRK